MQFNHQSVAKVVHPTVALSSVEMVKLLDVKDREIVHLRRQVAWFQRQIFGQKSERRLPEPEGVQGTLGELFEVIPDDVPPVESALFF
jgi:transposase